MPSNDSQRLPSFIDRKTLPFPDISKPELPRFHPHSSLYEQQFDLVSACNELRNDTDYETSRARIQIKLFPSYLKTAWKYVQSATGAPAGVGLVALIERSMLELDDNHHIVEYRKLRKRVDGIHSLPEHDKENLQDMLGTLGFTPSTPRVVFLPFRCTVHFRDRLAGAAAQLSMPMTSLAVTFIAIAMRDQPGVTEGWEAAMEDTYCKFICAIRDKTDDVTARLERYLERDRKTKQDERSRRSQRTRSSQYAQNEYDEG